MHKKALYSPKAIYQAFAQAIPAANWQESRTSYGVTEGYSLIRRTIHLPPQDQKRHIQEAGKRPICSYRQTECVKSRVAVELRFGKYSFIADDLFVKHLAFFVGDEIALGIEILPMKSMQEQVSSGPGYYDGVLYDLARQGRGVPAVPRVLVGVIP